MFGPDKSVLFMEVSSIQGCVLIEEYTPLPGLVWACFLGELEGGELEEGVTAGSRCLFTCLCRASLELKDMLQPFMIHLNGRSYIYSVHDTQMNRKY